MALFGSGVDSTTFICAVFDRSSRLIATQVGDFVVTAAPFAVNLHPKNAARVAGNYDRTLEEELTLHWRLANLLKTGATRRLRARILLYESLKHPMIRIRDAHGADVYSNDANLIFAFLLCASQLGDLRKAGAVPVELAADMNRYSRYLAHRRSATSHRTAQNQALVARMEELVG